MAYRDPSEARPLCSCHGFPMNKTSSKNRPHKSRWQCSILAAHYHGRLFPLPKPRPHDYELRSQIAKEKRKERMINRGMAEGRLFCLCHFLPPAQGRCRVARRTTYRKQWHTNQYYRSKNSLHNRKSKRKKLNEADQVRIDELMKLLPDDIKELLNV